MPVTCGLFCGAPELSKAEIAGRLARRSRTSRSRSGQLLGPRREVIVGSNPIDLGSACVDDELDVNRRSDAHRATPTASDDDGLQIMISVALGGTGKASATVSTSTRSGAAQWASREARARAKRPACPSSPTRLAITDASRTIELPLVRHRDRAPRRRNRSSRPGGVASRVVVREGPRDQTTVPLIPLRWQPCRGQCRGPCRELNRTARAWTSRHQLDSWIAKAHLHRDVVTDTGTRRDS